MCFPAPDSISGMQLASTEKEIEAAVGVGHGERQGELGTCLRRFLGTELSRVVVIHSLLFLLL